MLATILELFTGRGLDNISITLGTAFLAYLLANFEWAGSYIIPILLTPAIIAFAYKKKALTVSGIIAAIAVDIMISVSLGNSGFCILLLFFVGGILVDKIKKQYKKQGQNTISDIEKRGDCRDHVQVLANSLVASASAVAYCFTTNNLFVVAFVASIAEAFADTAASGIGVLSGRAFDLFRMRSCTPGISGGMSLVGTIASIAAAAIVCSFAFAIGMVDIIATLIVFVSAVLGGIFDSLLGSLIQVKYKCTVCDAIVEREEHCGQATERHSGLRIVTNDTVNLLGSLFAAVLAATIYNIM